MKQEWIDKERFWKSVDKTGECWLWTLSLDRDGYGQVAYRDDENRSRRSRAHRISFLLTHGEIPAGKMILHRCDNPTCCRPAHLFAGTHKENMSDMRRKKRGLSGERNSQAKLTENDVKEIRYRVTVKREPQDFVARSKGISQAMVHRIVTRKNWRM